MLQRGQQHAPCVSALLAKPEQPVVWIGTLLAGYHRNPDSGHLANELGRDEKEEQKERNKRTKNDTFIEFTLKANRILLFMLYSFFSLSCFFFKHSTGLSTILADSEGPKVPRDRTIIHEGHLYLDEVARQHHLAWPDAVGANTQTGG